jgi:hypothetical protein
MVPLVLLVSEALGLLLSELLELPMALLLLLLLCLLPSLHAPVIRRTCNSSSSSSSSAFALLSRIGAITSNVSNPTALHKESI